MKPEVEMKRRSRNEAEMQQSNDEGFKEVKWLNTEIGKTDPRTDRIAPRDSEHVTILSTSI